MAEQQHIIHPERLGLWTAASFIVALLALVVALAAVFRVHELGYVTQVEALMLNKQALDMKQCAPTAAVVPDAPANPAAASR